MTMWVANDEGGAKVHLYTTHLMAMQPPSNLGRSEPLINFESLEVKNGKKALFQSRILQQSKNSPCCNTPPKTFQSIGCV